MSLLDFCGDVCQVDLKLKICRGSSVHKILVREAKSYFATEIIVGTAQNHHSLRSSVSIAKYCAKKLSKNCSVLAVNNGKIAFHKDTSSKTNLGAAKGFLLFFVPRYSYFLDKFTQKQMLLQKCS